MPLLAINLSDTLFGQIKEHVEKGKYSSFEAFIEIAAFNQLALERGATPAEIVERGHRKINQAKLEAADVTEKPVERKKSEPEAQSKAAKVGVARRATEPVARIAPPDDTALTPEVLDTAFKRLALVARTQASPKPSEPTANGAVDEHVFGQVNRLMPLKLACRWLAAWASTEGKWPRYELVSDPLADDAATIGTLLDKWDVENERKRDELLATGLPRRGNSASRDRFLSQFLARVTRGGEIYPAVICQYQLARFDDSVIALTDRGQAFAELENPILDKQDQKSVVTLTPTESEFLARHIATWVPAERNDMRLVLRAVASGKTTPTDLAQTIRSEFPTDWSESSFQTHVSGLIARLGELRLLKRNWQGRNVNYELGNQTQVKDFIGADAQEQT